MMMTSPVGSPVGVGGSGPFADLGPMEATEYGGLGGGYSVLAAEVALGRDLAGEAATRLGMARRATHDAVAVDPATGMPGVQGNP